MVLVKIISGEQNSGKTTMAAALEEEYRRQGFKTAGFLSDAEYTNGRKDSYYFRDLVTGRRQMAVAASVPADEDGWVKHGFSRFYFSHRAFCFAEKLLKDAAAANHERRADYIFIDELGPLELAGEGLFNSTRDLVNSYHGRLIMVIRETLISPLCAKLGLESELIEIIRADYHAQ